MSKIANMMASAKQRGDFDLVCKHYRCKPEEIEEMREIANLDKAAAREYFSLEAEKIRAGEI